MDIWSLGIICYQLLQKGSNPFYASTQERIAWNICNLGPMFWGKVSDDAEHFVECCLIKECEKRYSADDLLKH